MFSRDIILLGDIIPTCRLSAPFRARAGLAEARRGAEPGLAPRAERSASGLTRTLFYEHALVSAAAQRSLLRGAALCRVHVSEQRMA